MWADNETDIDLLGFEFLVDELEVLLTEERLLPVTVGVSGDWGSGKTSLMEMTKKRLETGENTGRFITVSFSPWRFEDFNYGKVALMAAVVDAIADYADAAEDKSLLKVTAEKAGKLRGLLRKWGIARHGAAIGAAAAGATPEEAQAAAQAAEILAGPEGGDGDDEAPRSFATVAHFHTEFEALIDSLGDDVQAVVVFIDDMDRCSTETIIETFEAMRLFLHAKKTAYVVGAHEEIVEAALEGRYPARREGDERIGRNYLEKMLQNTVVVPPLSEPEAQTYINLLFAELYTTPAEFVQLREAAAERRARHQLSIAMTEGIARETIGDLSPDLTAALDIAEQVGPPLAKRLRGNPRQLKRFLNRFLLRKATADKRSMGLDADKLAKLMVLEELNPNQFEQLFAWHLEAETGAPVELALAEQIARDQKPKNPDQAVVDWAALPGMREWLLLAPSLAEVALGPYFTFSRDKLAMMVGASRLPPDLLQLLADLQSDVDPSRVKAVTTAAELDDSARGDVLPLLLEAAARDTGSAAATSLVELAKERTEVAAAMFEMLGDLAVGKVKQNFILRLGAAFRGDSRLIPLMERWETKGSTGVKRQARRALGKE